MSLLPYQFSEQDIPDFYKRLDLLSEQVFNRATETLGRIVYSDREDKILELPVSEQKQLILELLILGVYWRGHIFYAYQSQKLISRLARFSKSTIFNSEKKLILRRKTILSFLDRKSFHELKIKYNKKLLVDLVNWLKLLKKYDYETPVIEKWANHWKEISREEFTINMLILASFTDWFCEISDYFLGRHLNQEFFSKSQFLNIEQLNRRDIFQVIKPKEEYYLNAIAGLWMNEMHNDSFRKAGRKIVFAPGCMRPDGGRACKAKAVNGFMECIGCNESCNVYQLNRKGKEEGFEVKIVKHQSSLFKGDITAYKRDGIVGVACMSCLISGGLMLKQEGIEAKCLYLNAPGCSKHWLEKDEMTSISEIQLKEIVVDNLEVNVRNRSVG